MVIGSNRQKAQALRQGVLPQVLNLLGDPNVGIEIRRDACVTLGSLVKGTPDNVREVVTANSVPKLVSGKLTKIFRTKYKRKLKYAIGGIQISIG